MEAQTIAHSPWLDPRFLFPVVVAVVGLIAWFVRLEYKANATAARQKEYEEYMDDQIRKIESNHDKVKAAFYEHKGDTKVHHNEAMFDEFRKGLERRFTSIDETLKDISKKLDDRSPLHKTQG